MPLADHSGRQGRYLETEEATVPRSERPPGRLFYLVPGDLSRVAMISDNSSRNELGV